MNTGLTIGQLGKATNTKVETVRYYERIGLLAAPVYVVLYLLSGAATPVESMPHYIQDIVQFSPTTQSC